jgi:hypothetical protein
MEGRRRIFPTFPISAAKKKKRADHTFINALCSATAAECHPFYPGLGPLLPVSLCSLPTFGGSSRDKSGEYPRTPRHAYNHPYPRARHR